VTGRIPSPGMVVIDRVEISTVLKHFQMVEDFAL
jgi:hypothetical protein